eukprot:scaffold142257_cov145-Phaeocystis_antarctica.AAC.1
MQLRGQNRCATVAPRTSGQDPGARSRSTAPFETASRIRNRGQPNARATCSTGRKAYKPPSESSRRKA